jgi:Na+/H+-dicarboxylate symporters
MKKIKIGLLPRVIIAIILGILFSMFLPVPIVRIFETFNALFSSFLGFIIPLLIIGLVAPSIADLGKGAGRLLVIVVVIAYTSTILSGFFSYFTTAWSLPLVLSPTETLSASTLVTANAVTPYFSIPLTPVMDVMSALVFAFVLGLGVIAVNGVKSKEVLKEFGDIIVVIIKYIIVPLLPLFIFGIFLKIGAEGQVPVVLGLFFKVIVIIFVMHVLLLLFQYGIAGIIARRNPFRVLLTMLTAYATALGTQSSAATIPVSLAQIKKSGIDPDLADFMIPITVNIHLAGSILKIVSCAYAIMYMSGLPAGLDLFTGFIFMLAIIMVAAPGVPGGAIMASIALLQSMLGFDETTVGLMIALYIAMDSFGTAANVTGDGAIAIIMNKIYLKDKAKSQTHSVVE